MAPQRPLYYPGTKVDHTVPFRERREIVWTSLLVGGLCLWGRFPTGQSATAGMPLTQGVVVLWPVGNRPHDHWTSHFPASALAASLWRAAGGSARQRLAAKRFPNTGICDHLRCQGNTLDKPQSQMGRMVMSSLSGGVDSCPIGCTDRFGQTPIFRRSNADSTWHASLQYRQRRCRRFTPRPHREHLFGEAPALSASTSQKRPSSSASVKPCLSRRSAKTARSSTACVSRRRSNSATTSWSATISPRASSRFLPSAEVPNGLGKGMGFTAYLSLGSSANDSALRRWGAGMHLSLEYRGAPQRPQQRFCSRS